MNHFLVLLQFVAFAFVAVKGQSCGDSFNIDHWKYEIEAAKDSNNAFQKILGGDIAPNHAWPWVIDVESPGSRCSGSLIAPNWAITAKHCYSTEMTIKYGANSWTEGTLVTVAESFYTGAEEQIESHDILLLRLNESISFSNEVGPVCLRREISEKENDFDVAAGFGNYVVGEPENGENYIPNTILRESIVPLHRSDHGRCLQIPYDDATEICGGAYNEGTTPGDSGGPLMALIDGRWYQHGVCSRGIYLHADGDPQLLRDEGIYTDVTKFCDWIEDTTGGEARCE